jgi:virginiamycin B lyase
VERHREIRRLVILLATFASGLVLCVVSLLGRSVGARATPQQSQPATGNDNLPDDLQRSLRLDAYTLVADSGAARGENIYFYKCWMCHNKYTQSAPYLKDLYKRPNLMLGKPVNDDTVAEQIKAGGPGMPAFGTTLSGSEISDLVTYIKEGKCCVEGENPLPNPWYHAATQKWLVQSELSGGAWGVVRIASGDSAEGVGVQLIAPNGVRTTVYTNEEGKYEFPKMQAGVYTLRIPTPLIFKPYRRDSVEIDRAPKLDDIVLERVSKTDDLPPTPGIESQMSGAELLWNLPGTGQEKATFQKVCSSCHAWQQVFRNRYDERSWGLIVDRMVHYYSDALAVHIQGKPAPDRATDEDVASIVKWLAKVRGPESQDAPLRVFPRPRGASTRVIVTEYELPRALLALHDVYGDSKGNLWYTSHKTQYAGKLDPRTGIVAEYTLPLTPGAMPGTHHVVVDKNDIVWFSENWAHNLDRLDPQTGKITQVHIESPNPINAGGFSNFGLGSDGFIWTNQAGHVQKLDPETGKVLQQYPLQTSSSYDNLISYDGNFWAGGGPARYGNTAELLDMRTGKWVLNLNTGAHMATAKRGGFDPYGNAWFGGADGALIELDAKAGRIVEHWPPTAPSPVTDFYEAMPDKNGEVWAGVLHGRQMVRLDPRTEKWTVYELPEPFAYDRYNWIDNSTHPVTVWYVDYDGYLVRVQPLE